jgi:transcriptional regulator with XRE-family HTH domain
MTKENFIDWLREEINIRKWSQAEFARQTKLSPAQITRLLNGERGVGEAGLNAISRALRLPAELVFEKAGLLPPKQELTPKKRELMERLKDAEEADVQMVIEMLEAAVKAKQRQVPANLHPKTNSRQ